MPQNWGSENFNVEREFPLEFIQDCKDVLRRCLVVLQDMPDTPVQGSRGLTTGRIVNQIKELLNN